MSHGITLGADPELIFVGPNGLVSANDYLPQQLANGNNPTLGADGHPFTAEIRPPPAETPQGLIANIKAIFQNENHQIPEGVSWQAGSYVMHKAIGGHIHFGNSHALDREEFLDYLDGVLLQVTILLEDTEGARRRRHSNYGQLGDCRSKGPSHFEYRPLASWIVSESIALGVVALAKALAVETLERGPCSLKRLKTGPMRALTQIDKACFRNCDKDYFYDKFDLIFGLIRKLHYWQTDEGKALWKNVALLRHIIRNYPDWHNDRDVLDRWGIRPTPNSYNFRRVQIQPVIQQEEVIQAQNAWDILNVGG